MDCTINENIDPEIKNETSSDVSDSTKIKKEANPIRKRKIKMENTFNDITSTIPSSSAFESYSTQFINGLPPNTVDNSSQNFVPYFGFMTTDQYKSLIRLVHLFPQLHTATLKGALELCNYDTIQTIDSILYALQYRKYLEAKNQGFPIDYNVRGPRILLLPSFLGNRSTNSNVYEQLFQDNAYFNNAQSSGGGEMNKFVHTNFCTTASGVTDTKNVINPCFSGYQLSNEKNIEHNFQSSENCLPPFRHLAQCLSPHSSKESNTRHHNMAKYPASFLATNKSDKEEVVDSNDITVQSSSGGNSARPLVINEDKKTIKSTKVKRLIKSKQVISRSKIFDKKHFKLPKLVDSKSVEETKISSETDITNMELMDTVNDCIIVESSSQIEIQSVIDSHKNSQCPLGDKDCNEIFQTQ